MFDIVLMAVFCGCNGINLLINDSGVVLTEYLFLYVGVITLKVKFFLQFKLYPIRALSQA